MSVPHCVVVNNLVASHKLTIFGKQITDQTVCLIVHMWKRLPLL